MIQDDLAYVRKLLPDHYNIYESRKIRGNIRCVSPQGIKFKGKPDEEHWLYITSAMALHFGRRMTKIYHHVDHCYVDFTIYLSKK